MKTTVQLHPGQRSDAALRAILLEQLEALQSTVDGVVDDLDIEFLHDFRVASRRTRSALTQLKAVLDKDAVRPFLADFKWLGEITGPCRDLDVHLEDLEFCRSAAPVPVAFEERLRFARSEAHRQVVEGIRSPRFQTVLEQWRRFLEQPPEVSGIEPRKADIPVEDLAARLILKAYRKVLRQGETLGSQPSAAGMHRTRIEAKKLRYLLEFFNSLYPADRIVPLVKELKAFQDILGGFQDGEVQRGRLLEIGRAVAEDGEVTSATEAALGEIETLLTERQEAYRSEFHGRFQVFASAASRAEYESLFGGK